MVFISVLTGSPELVNSWFSFPFFVGFLAAWYLATLTLSTPLVYLVEQKLENYLGIEDRQVKGAYGNTNKKESMNEFEDTESKLDLIDLKYRPAPEIEKRDNWIEDEFI